MPTTYTVDTDGVTGDYASLSAAIAGVPSTLDDDYIIECQASTDVADTTTVAISKTLSGFTLTIRAATGEEAGKTWDTGKYRLTPSASFSAALRTDTCVTIETIQIQNTAGNAVTAVEFQSGVSDCILDSCFITQDDGSGVRDNGTDDIIVNCIIVGSGSRGVDKRAAGGSLYVYNTTIGGSFTYGIFGGDWRTVFAKNCYAGGTGTADLFEDTNGTITLTTTYTEDGSLSTTTAAYSTSSGCYFTNVTAGSEDFTIGASSALIGNGTDLSADATHAFSDDIDTDTRSDWDIGADEHVAAGGNAPTGNIAGPLRGPLGGVAA